MSSSQLVPLPERAERLITQCRATSDSHHSNPLRTGRLMSEHRQLLQLCEELFEERQIRESFIEQVLRYLRNIFNSFSGGSNGRRSWNRDIPQAGKTALISAHSFIHRHK